MNRYKVWIEIEEWNEETGEGDTLDAPGASIASFDTYDEAWAFALALGATEIDMEPIRWALERGNK